jgi:hypothetical protein
MSSHYTIELLGTSGCHLCEEAQLIMLEVIEQTAVHAMLIDIADHAQSDVLIARYGLRLPVLRINGRELDWPFSAEQVIQWMQCP